MTHSFLVRAGMILALAALPIAPANAQPRDFQDGNSIYAICGSQEHVNGMRCLAFLKGFIVGTSAASLHFAVGTSAAETGRPLPFCLPENVTLGQLRDVIVNDLRRLPHIRHQSAQPLLMVILENAFPCRRSN